MLIGISIQLVGIVFVLFAIYKVLTEILQELKNGE